MSIGKRLKTRRLELAMTLEDVAKKVERTSPTIQRYESGEIDIPHSVIERLAHLQYNQVKHGGISSKKLEGKGHLKIVRLEGKLSEPIAKTGASRVQETG